MHKTACFSNVTKVDGALTVTPAAVTITTGSDTKEFDGTPLTAAADIEGLAAQPHSYIFHLLR